MCLNMRDFGRVRPVIAAAVALAFASPCAAQLPCAYHADIVFGPDCGGGDFASTLAFGISEEGDLSGEFGCPGALPDAFVSWDANGLTPLAAFLPPGTYVSRAVDVEDGMIVGDFASPAMAGGFVIHNGTVTIIPPVPGTDNIDVYGVNAQGTVVGAWGNTVSGPLLFPRAFRWRDGALHDISVDLLPMSWALDVNDHGAITGYMGQTAFPNNAHAFIWENGVVTDLGLMPGSIGTEGWGINNQRQVCGVAWFLSKHPQGYQRRGFFWDNGVFTDIGVIPGYDDEMQPQDIAEDGTVIGFMNEGPGFVWKAGVLRNLDTLVQVPVGRAGGFPRDTTRGGTLGIDGFYLPPGPSNSEGVAIRLRPVPRLPGDTNCDRVINIDDLLTVISFWGAHGVDADVNGSSSVDIDDLLIVLSNWGASG